MPRIKRNLCQNLADLELSEGVPDPTLFFDESPFKNRLAEYGSRESFSPKAYHALKEESLCEAKAAMDAAESAYESMMNTRLKLFHTYKSLFK